MKKSSFLNHASAFAAFAGLSLSATQAAAQFVAYHDFGATTGQESTGFITTHQSGASNVSNNALDTSTKALMDYTTGAATGVLFSINRANGMDSRSPDITRPPAPGTPADPLFNVPGLNLDNGLIYVGNAVSRGGRQPDMTITLTGLDPVLTYDLALYGDRNIAADGAERFTLGGADAATNASSTGIIDTFTTDMETRPNATAGNIVRWTGINPGADGTITILVDPDPANANTTNIAYLSALRLEAVGQSSITLRIRPAEAPDTGFDLEWDSQSGKLYNLRTSTDLVGTIAEWGLVAGGEDIAATPPTNIFNVDPADPRRFYAIEEFDAPPPPPLLSEDFETGDGGFTVATVEGTSWERGTPDSSGLGGTVSAGNDASANAWGTNLGTFSSAVGTPTDAERGFYANPTETALRSPVIDLTEVAGAELTFAEALDIPNADTAVVVNLINATTDDVIALIHTSTDGDPNNAQWSDVGPINLAAGLGQQVRIEWRLEGTGAPTFDFMGWYIDDVLVTETTP